MPVPFISPAETSCGPGRTFDLAPVWTAIEKIESHDQLDGIIEIAFGEGVHPREGFELLLKH